HQQIYISTLKDSVTDFMGKEFGSPSLVIIGDVVHLHTDFNWFANQKSGSVFNELVKQSILQ
ncbi:MAG: uroporphyrinogen-III C-methyltransferase, partial [Saprospiraceae bacterium]